MMTESTLKGACNYGAIAISIPKSSIPSYCGLCHCLNCRASSGSFFSVNIPTPSKDVTITGTTKIYADKDSVSGHTANRHFCPDCGSAVMTIISEQPDNAFVKGGLFARSGYVIPPPGLQQFMRSCETWEKPMEGVQALE